MQNQTESELYGSMKMLSTAFSAVIAIADQNFRHIHFATDPVEGILIDPESNRVLERQEKKVNLEFVNLKLKRDNLPKNALRFRVPVENSDKEINMFLDLNDVNFDVSSSKDNTLSRALAFKNVYENLTLRERQVMVLVSERRTSKDISGILRISETTVKNHRKNAKKKIQKIGSHNEVKFLSWLANHLGEQNGAD